MRKKVVAGNWKMNLTLDEAKALVERVCEALEGASLGGVEVVFCPPFPYLVTVGSLLRAVGVGRLGAQNVHWEKEGAYTGEVSASMLRSVGCSYVIIGHSERRHYFQEDESLLLQKMRRAWEEDLIPIYCVGETLAQRERNETESVLSAQLSIFLELRREQKAFLLAYEPVWAIGTGKAATPEMANTVHRFLRDWFNQHFEHGFGEKLTILYGGSVKPENALELFRQPEIDGGLIGGASIHADQFLSIVNAMISVTV